MKYFLFLIITAVCLSANTEKRAELYVNFEECINCNVNKYYGEIQSLKLRNYEIDLIVEGVTANQYNGTKKVLNRYFGDEPVNIIIDTSNTNKVNSKRNIVLLYEDGCFIQEYKVSGFDHYDHNTNNNDHSQKIVSNKNNIETNIYFADNVPLNMVLEEFHYDKYNQTIIFNDIALETFLFIDIIRGEVVNSRDYYNLRSKYINITDSVSEKEFKKINKKMGHYFFCYPFVDINRNPAYISQVINGFEILTQRSNIYGNFKPTYSYVQLDSDFNTTSIFNAYMNDLSMRRPPINCGNKILFECYDRDYHFTKHDSTKYQSHFLAELKADTLIPFGLTIGELQEIEDDSYAYEFPNLYSYDESNNKLFIVNTSNSLFAYYDVNDDSKINMIEPVGIVKEAFKRYENVSVASIYSGQFNIQITEGEVSSFIANEGNCILLYRTRDTVLKSFSWATQVYDHKGNYKGTYSLEETFKDENLLECKIMGVRQQRAIFLTRSKEDVIKIVEIPLEEFNL